MVYVLARTPGFSRSRRWRRVICEAATEIQMMMIVEPTIASSVSSTLPGNSASRMLATNPKDTVSSTARRGTLLCAVRLIAAGA